MESIMCASRILRRGCLLLIVLLAVDILIASPGRAGPRNLMAHFFPIIPGSISLFFGGPGDGAVTIVLQPVGVPATCSADCTKTMGALGRTVSLTATPAPDSLFAGWGGACS